MVRVRLGVALGVIETGTPKRTRCVDQIEQIWSGERIAAGQDQLRQRTAEIGDLPQKANAFLERELQRMRVRHRFSAAVATGERTRLRHFPVDIERRQRKIARRMTHGANRLWWSRHSYTSM